MKTNNTNYRNYYIVELYHELTDGCLSLNSSCEFASKKEAELYAKQHEGNKTLPCGWGTVNVIAKVKRCREQM